MQKRARRKISLAHRLNAVTTPVFLLNPKRQIVFFNSGCEELTGWKAADVVGRVCEYASDADHIAVESLTTSFCPPPEVVSGTSVSAPAHLVHRDGHTSTRLLHFFPLMNAQGELDSILGTVTAIRQPARPVEATSAQQLHAELASLRSALRQRFGLKSFVCRNEPMRRVLEQIQLATQTTAAVFLHGEEGTGKEHVARLIHYESAARARSFVPLDCRRLSALELKQTLTRLLDGGKVESATVPILQPGTVYLAHVEHLPRDLQERLAAAFLGDQSSRRPELRLLASSTTDLRRAVADDTLRSDLFYLLTPIEIELPPLRRRPEDLQPLAQFFLEMLNRGAERQVGGFTEPVWQQFAEYNWPGNLDELAAVVAEARAACTEALIKPEHLPFRFRTGLAAQAVGPAIQSRVTQLEPLLTQVETEHIRLALEQSRYNKSKAADLLGITRARLYRRMEVLGIEDRMEE